MSQQFVQADAAWRRGFTKVFGVMRPLPLYVALSLFLSGSASGSHTMCDFLAKAEDKRYEFELLGGSSEISMIQVNSPRGQAIGQYEIRDFDYAESRIHLIHTNRSEPGLLPSFSLQGSREEVTLTIDGKEIVGKLTCMWEWIDG